ncbi:urease accessory protein UreD [Rhodopseudomonas pseudopalustris]|uniref:Urease accessory protein UreD n=1 Tax=Rhodopseudomonas pseudopalustris TaxID=1513892 RepID=A0A1H8QNJ0_9BRAD|nr:urease accessory protein UreD [Rhodopseudomonas pseudopalustris]SEO55770.1 urease accessory protein [Rhodopseudomonas pseudopalustris]
MQTESSRREAAAATEQLFAANRAQGSVQFDVRSVDDVTRRGKLHESGSLRVRFPSPEQQGLSAVLVNTAGGVAGGDRFSIDIAVGESARLTLTTAAAEKIYRSHGPSAQLDITLKVADDGHLGWLPQETILFDQARVERRIDIELAPRASLLLCESVIFGRSAMGETMRHGRFIDRWRLRVGGKLVFAETVRLDGEIGPLLDRPAVAKGGVAVGTALIAPGDSELVERLRENADLFGAEVGITAWNGIAMARFCAQDAARLRADMMAVLRRAAGRALPRLWLS